MGGEVYLITAESRSLNLPFIPKNGDLNYSSIRFDFIRRSQSFILSTKTMAYYVLNCILTSFLPHLSDLPISVCLFCDVTKASVRLAPCKTDLALPQIKKDGRLAVT